MTPKPTERDGSREDAAQVHLSNEAIAEQEGPRAYPPPSADRRNVRNRPAFANPDRKTVLDRRKKVAGQDQKTLMNQRRESLIKARWQLVIIVAPADVGESNQSGFAPLAPSSGHLRWIQASRRSPRCYHKSSFSLRTVATGRNRSTEVEPRRAATVATETRGPGGEMAEMTLVLQSTSTTSRCTPVGINLGSLSTMFAVFNLNVIRRKSFKAGSSTELCYAKFWKN